MKRDYQEPLKKWTLFFLSNLASFDGQSFQKLKGSGTRDLLVFRLRNNFTKISLLVILTDQVWWCNTKRFLSYSKYFIYTFMQANSWHQIIPFPFVLLNLPSVKRKSKNYKTLNISRTKNEELFRWNKKHFSVFHGLSLGEKIKIW